MDEKILNRVVPEQTARALYEWLGEFSAESDKE